ncbi:hypothetical protein J6590_051137 [Homalodisca vitripennis]|nr:hypothetical protein J6590_051137 [Homalodisca vitripennis]
MSVEFQKANIEAKNRPNPKRRKRTNSSCPLSSPSSSSSSSAPNLQDRDNALGQVLSTPGVLNALPYMTALGGLSKLLEGNSSSDRITGVYYSKDFQLGVHSPGGHSVTDPDSTKDHNKSVPS